MDTDRWPFIMASLDDYIFTCRRHSLHLFTKLPKFLEILAEKDTATYAPWINTCRRTLEYEFKNQLNRISSVRDIVDIDPIEIEIRTKEDKYTPISIQWPEGTIQQHRKYLLEENPAKKKKR